MPARLISDLECGENGRKHVTPNDAIREQLLVMNGAQTVLKSSIEWPRRKAVYSYVERMEERHRALGRKMVEKRNNLPEKRKCKVKADKNQERNIETEVEARIKWRNIYRE